MRALLHILTALLTSAWLASAFMDAIEMQASLDAAEAAQARQGRVAMGIR